MEKWRDILTTSQNVNKKVVQLKGGESKKQTEMHDEDKLQSLSPFIYKRNWRDKLQSTNL